MCENKSSSCVAPHDQIHSKIYKFISFIASPPPTTATVKGFSLRKNTKTATATTASASATTTKQFTSVKISRFPSVHCCLMSTFHLQLFRTNLRTHFRTLFRSPLYSNHSFRTFPPPGMQLHCPNRPRWTLTLFPDHPHPPRSGFRQSGPPLNSEYWQERADISSIDYFAAKRFRERPEFCSKSFLIHAVSWNKTIKMFIMVYLHVVSLYRTFQLSTTATKTTTTVS